jgi:serine/threonine-protein kinase
MATAPLAPWGPPNVMEPGAAHVSHALGLDLCGVVLDGRYQVVRRIGAGGMAAVYEARRVGLERRFAVKILRPELAESESNVKRFLREARAAASVQHPNIVSIEDVGSATVPVYFVMEYLEGVDLRQELKRVGRFEWGRTQDLTLQIVDALAAAHNIGIIHRDVKPANCFLIRDQAGAERIKVLDFGIAKVLEESQEFTQNVTATHGIVGTVAYMAPEQARSGTVDARTDVYALGTMLYEMLTGTVPFPDKNPFVVIGRLLGENPVPLRMHRPDLPAELDAVVMTCLEKDPAARFQSMEALGNAISVCQAEGSVVSTAKVRLPSGLVRAAKPVVQTAVRVPAIDAASTPAPAGPPTSGPPTGAPTSQLGNHARSSGAVALAESPSSTALRRRRPASGQDTALLGVLIGGIGMLALGGTATWWALKGRNDADAGETAPASIEPAETPAATVVPTPILQPVLVPIPTGGTTAEASGEDAKVEATTAPVVVGTPPATTTGRRRPRAGEPVPVPSTTTTTTPTTTTTAPATTTTTPDPTGRRPDISPDLRNPFGMGPKK